MITVELTNNELKCLRNFVSVSYEKGYPGNIADYGNLNDVEFNALLVKLGFNEKQIKMYGAQPKYVAGSLPVIVEYR